jgi:hypothetical protein
MNSTQALAKARKLLGAKAFVRVNKGALAGEERQTAITAHLDALTKRTAAEEALTARRTAVLAADVEYQRLKAELAAARQAVEACRVGIFNQRVDIGTASGWFHTIHASGDNFAEALESLAEKKGQT